MTCCKMCTEGPNGSLANGNCIYYPLNVWIVGGLLTFTKGLETLHLFANGDPAVLPFYPKKIVSDGMAYTYTSDLTSLVDTYTDQGYTLTYSSQELVILDSLFRSCGWNASPIPTSPPYNSVVTEISVNMFPVIPFGYVLSDDTGIYLPQDPFDGLALTYPFRKVVI